MSDGIYGEPAKPFARWTKDTELAFLQALRLTGQAKKAADAIGRSPNSAYTYRKRHPDFARRWDETIAAQQREWIAAHQERLAARGGALDESGGERLEPGQERAGGWDARKKGLFLRVLKRTKTVTEACEAAGMAPRAAYALRARSPRFAAAWEKALADAPPPSVREAALARAVDGWDEPIVHAGQVVGYKKRYSDGLLRDLLREEQARTGAAEEQVLDFETARESILRKIEAIERHDEKRAVVERAAAWMRWRQSWLL